MVTVSACQAISTAKGLAEGAEDGVRDTLCGSVCIGPYGDEYQIDEIDWNALRPIM